MTTNNENAQDLLVDVVTTMIQTLVDDESAVSVDVIAETLHTNLRVTTAPSDFGKVLGRGGQTIEALRTLVSAMGSKLRLPFCTLFVVDPRKVGRNAEAWEGARRRSY